MGCEEIAVVRVRLRFWCNGMSRGITVATMRGSHYGEGGHLCEVCAR